MNRKAFYAALRKRHSGVFGTSLSGQQVKGIEGILDAFESHGDDSNKTLAYALATTYHETGRKMVPVREGFARSDKSARRIVRHRKYGKPAEPHAHVYYGRGQVQLTHMRNYKRSSEDAGVDLVKYPDKMLEPIISARVLIAGLIDGRWNGHNKGIGFYLPPHGRDDLRNARRTVNITDKWKLIAGYYRSFLKAIEAGLSGGTVPKRPPAPPMSTPPVSTLPEPAKPTPDEPAIEPPIMPPAKPPAKQAHPFVALLRALLALFKGQAT